MNNKKYKEKDHDEGVSPVIATILMVAITVVLSGVLYVWASELAGNQTDSGSLNNYTVEESYVASSDGNNDKLLRMAFSNGPDDLQWSFLTITLFDENSGKTYKCSPLGEQCSISEENVDNSWSGSEIIGISESNTDICNSESDCELKVTAQYKGKTIAGNTNAILVNIDSIITEVEDVSEPESEFESYIYENAGISYAPVNDDTTSIEAFSLWFEEKGLVWDDSIYRGSTDYKGWYYNEMNEFNDITIDEFIEYIIMFCDEHPNSNRAVFKNNVLRGVGSDIIDVSFRQSTSEVYFSDDSPVFKYVLSSEPVLEIPSRDGQHSYDPEFLRVESVVKDVEYAKTFVNLDIYDTGELYDLRIEIKQSSFKVGDGSDYSQATEPNFDLDGDLETFYEKFIFWEVEYSFDRELSGETGIVYFNVEDNDDGRGPSGSSAGGSGISEQTVKRIYFQSHMESYNTGPIVKDDMINSFNIIILNKEDPNNNPVVLDDSMLIGFNMMWLENN
ncbi:MAG: hypothetical protein CMB56_006490 [Methanobacteriota archaeon]|nr:MAG: hypothetical protein CMB56_006490 [Euryarchaeota archaeon]|tara:strand:- start:7217 stop:8728 length:1512 start_codon:yes stop_codon:yes gene_type:complete